MVCTKKDSAPSRAAPVALRATVETVVVPPVSRAERPDSKPPFVRRLVNPGAKIGRGSPLPPGTMARSSTRIPPFAPVRIQTETVRAATGAVRASWKAS